MINKEAINDSTFYDAVRAVNAEYLKRKALSNALAIGALGLGTGLTLRGLGGLKTLAERNVSQKAKPSVPAMRKIPIPVIEEEEGQEKLSKFDPAGFMHGDYATNVAGVPYAMPAAVGAGAAGLVGGWKFLDWILNARRKADIKGELDAAKKEYEDALFNAVPKTAGEKNELGEALDSLYDTIEKQALDVLGPSATNALGSLAGAYGTYAGITSVVPAILMYNWAKKRQTKTLLEKARKANLRKRFERSPSIMLAEPDPNWLGAHARAPSEVSDEEIYTY